MPERRSPLAPPPSEGADAPPVDVTLEREYSSEEEAAALLQALEPDRPEYLESAREGARVRFRVVAESAGSARATLEDLLAALSAAERARGLRPALASRRPATRR